MDDLEADFLRFYGIDLDGGTVKVGVIASAKVYRLAVRLPYYQGAMTAVVEAQREEEKNMMPPHLRNADIRDSKFESLDDLPPDSPFHEFMK